MSNLSTQNKRVIVVIAGMPFVFCLINYYFNLHFLEGYDLTALIVSTAVVLILVILFEAELTKKDKDVVEDEYQETKQRAKMSNLSAKKKKAFVATASILLIFCLYNYYFDLHFFGSYDLTALVVSVVIVFILVKVFELRFFKK